MSSSFPVRGEGWSQSGTVMRRSRPTRSERYCLDLMPSKMKCAALDEMCCVVAAWAEAGLEDSFPRQFYARMRALAMRSQSRGKRDRTSRPSARRTSRPRADPLVQSWPLPEARTEGGRDTGRIVFLLAQTPGATWGGRRHSMRLSAVGSRSPRPPWWMCRSCPVTPRPLRKHSEGLASFAGCPARAK